MTSGGFDLVGRGQQFSVNIGNLYGDELMVMMKTLPAANRGKGYLYRDSNGYVRVGL